jgi:hypothetical protein
MKEKLTFVEFLFKDLLTNAKTYIKNEEGANKHGGYPWANYMNKNHGKCALKRKITYLRQELLNLERMLDQ